MTILICHTRKLGAVVLVLVLASALAACHNGSGRAGSPYSPMTEADRDANLAQTLTQEAAAIIDSNPDKAEHLLREALTADLYHGAAHNNLGTIYLSRGDLYAAASEFEWARKLMPGSPDPRMNLALTLEKAGRTDDAIKAYQTALDVQAEHLPTVQALTRLQVRSGKADEQTRERLEMIAMRGDPAWRDWARLQLLAPQTRHQSATP